MLGREPVLTARLNTSCQTLQRTAVCRWLAAALQTGLSWTGALDLRNLSAGPTDAVRRGWSLTRGLLMCLQ
jgi:hypothetical protein